MAITVTLLTFSTAATTGCSITASSDTSDEPAFLNRGNTNEGGNQGGDGGGGNPGGAGSIALDPKTASVQAGRTLSLKVTGGTGPYTFTVSPATGGGTVAAGAKPEEAVYTAPRIQVSGVKVSAKDSKGATADAEISIDAPGPFIPNDTQFSSLYGMNGSTADIDGPEAWGVMGGSDCSNILIAVIDTGIDYNHEDLAGNMWKNDKEIAANGIDDDQNGCVDDIYGCNLVGGNNGNPKDDQGHGTHVAGTIAAIGNNNVGVAGVCWKAKLVAVKALNSQGSGATSDLIEAIQYSAKIGAHVSNNSWGGGGFTQGLFDAISAAEQAGQVFAAAAGNGGQDGVGDPDAEYPAKYNLPNVVAVAAIDSASKLTSFSNYSGTNVDIAAPGLQINSCKMNGGYVRLSGTSMATPHVAGVAGVIAAELARKNNGTPAGYQAVIDQLYKGAKQNVATLSGKVANGRQLNLMGSLP